MFLNASERKHSSWIVSFLAVFMTRLHVRVRCAVLFMKIYAVSFFISCFNASGGTYVQSYLVTRGTPQSILIYDRHHASVQAKQLYTRIQYAVLALFFREVLALLYI